MREITQTGSCKAPFSCVKLHEVPVPTYSAGECLVKVNATSVNPSDVDTAETFETEAKARSFDLGAIKEVLKKEVWDAQPPPPAPPPAPEPAEG